MSTINNNYDNEKVTTVCCPSIDELSTITNELQCKICNLILHTESQLKMHNVKVHMQKNLDKICKENIFYHCPVENCIYAPNNQRHFKLYKYLKQHYLKVHAEKKFICTNCTKRFPTNAAKEAHIRTCGTDYICECQKVYNSYEALLTHAKRKSHKIDIKYKSKRCNNKNIYKQNTLCSAVIYVLPKPTCDVAIQTEEITTTKSKSPKNKVSKKQICRQTQTNNSVKEKQVKKSAETQTAKTVSRVIRVHQVGKRKKISIDKDSILTEDISLLETLSYEHLPPDSPLPLRHDIILQDLWEEPIKNTFTFTSGTQTSPEKDIFETCKKYNEQDVMYHRTSRSDPMLTEKIFTDKFNSIETQTEEEYCRSIFEADSLNSNNERQTTENFTEAMEPLIYNDTYTQTCDEILSSDLVFSDIQTQTAWSYLDESTISTENRSKILKCANCSDSTNHMETQTDLPDIFEALR